MRTCLAALLLTCAAGSLNGQQVSDLVGTWRLVSMDRPDSSGRRQPYWDERPIGLIIYTADGHVAAQLYDSRRPRLGVRWEIAPADAAQSAYAGLITYFGTYRVDRTSRTVTHTVEGAMSPDWIGNKLVRAYRFLGPDRVELRVITTGEGQPVANGPALIWERVR
jgi:lipocalin-like protein